MLLALRHSCLAIALVLGGSTGASAAEPVPQHNSNAFWFENWVGLSNARLIVVAPNGKVTEIFAVSGTPVFQLERGQAMDGPYRFELSAATEETTEIVNKFDDGRGDASKDTVAVPFYAQGHFTVSRGAIITPKDIEEEG